MTPVCATPLPGAITQFHPGAPLQVQLGWAQVELLPAQPYAVRQRLAWPTAGVALERQRGVHAFASDRRQPFDAWPGELTLITAQTEVCSESEAGGEYLLVRSPLLASLAGEAGRLVLGADPAALRHALALRRALMQPPGPALPALDDAAMTLVAALAPLVPARQRQGCATGSGHGSMAQVLEAIEADVGAAWRLTDLAQVAGLSPLSFFRRFVRATGFTPHAYVMERRLQHARRLLSHRDVPLAEVAAACGYAQQSHLGEHLRRSTGRTPAAWRDAVR